MSSRWVELPGARRPSAPGGLPAGLPRRRRGLRASSRPAALDLGLLVSDAPDTVSAARFTRSGVLAAPVRAAPRSAARLDALRAVVANSGNANAATGRRGLEDAARMQGAAAMARAACAEDQVAVASTGVIGVPLDADARSSRASLAARGELRRDGDDGFAEAIRTTDRFPKRASLDVALPVAAPSG